MTDQASAPPGGAGSRQEPLVTDPPTKRTLLGLASLSGTLWVAGGSALLGASGYAFLTLTIRVVSPAEHAALSSLYLLVALVGPALFIPVEQETTRLVSRAHALDEGTRGVLSQLGRASALMAVVGVLALLAAGPFLVHRIFHGSVGMLIALMLSVAGYGGACLIRGTFAGQRRLRGYGVLVGVDGLIRLLPCLVLVVAGVASGVPYAIALGLGSVAALVVGLVWFRPGSPGPTVSWRDLLTAIGWLVAAWGASFALSNIAPVIVNALLPSDPARVDVFSFAFVLARVPVFVLLSLQAILLPALTRSAATRDLVGLRRGIRQAMLVVGALGLIALVTTAPLCLWLINVLFKRPGTLSALTLTLLAVGTILAMAVQVLQPALIAIAGHRVVAAAWLAGVAVFAACFLLPVDPVAAATTAQVAAGVATTAVMTFALLRLLRTTDTTPSEVPA